jgi:DNA-binding LacI/PurR family transcriptional regulator
MKSPRSQPKPRVGLRDIASAAGVCLMTVSLSLRGSPKISAATRDRIQQLADQMGYRPDPEISRLMRHLRSSRTMQGKVGLVIVDFYPTADFVENSYNQRIRQGAIRRATELGFSATALHAADCDFNLKHLLKVVRHRGLDGALLLPSVATTKLDPSVDWRDISVVATSNSILAPRFHSVVPHQFANMMRLIETMQSRGHRRICAIFDEFFDERTAHNFTAAVNWHHHGHRTLVLPGKMNAPEKAALVTHWIEKHQPDLIFAQASDAVADAMPQLRRSRRGKPFEIVGLGAASEFSMSYLDERPELVGSGAVDLLAGMIYYHETGIPEHPRTTMIDCAFHLMDASDAAGSAR